MNSTNIKQIDIPEDTPFIDYPHGAYRDYIFHICKRRKSTKKASQLEARFYVHNEEVKSRWEDKEFDGPLNSRKKELFRLPAPSYCSCCRKPMKLINFRISLVEENDVVPPGEKE